MITKEDYIKKINREKKRVTENVINAIKTHIETCADGMPIVEKYTFTEYEAKYFNEYSLDKLREEYPFLKFETDFITIKWRLK